MDVDIDLYDPAIRANPYAVYAMMRARQPVCRVQPQNIWALSRYDDVRAALRDHGTFASKGFKIILNPPWFNDPVMGGSMLATDPPEHTRLRSLVKKAFTPGVIQNLEPTMEQAARALATDLRGNSDIEFLRDFSYPYVSRVIGKVVGFEPGIHPEIKKWIDLYTYVTPTPPPPDIRRALQQVHDRVLDYGRDIIASRRHQQQDDLISHIVGAEIAGEKLSDQECLSLLILLLGAGFDTTVNLLTNCVRQLSAAPELVMALRGDPALIPLLIEEVMRFDPPTHALLRQVTRDVEIAGVNIAKDSLVFLMLASAGRDGSHYSDPDTFDLQRKDCDHLSFGYGIHACIGMLLARREVAVALGTLVNTFSSFHCPQPARLDWNYAFAARGVKRLPIRLGDDGRC
jgi:cytochrome P450